MFLLETETDDLLESYSNIAIGQIWLDQPDSADLSKSCYEFLSFATKILVCYRT